MTHKILIISHTPNFVSSLIDFQLNTDFPSQSCVFFVLLLFLFLFCFVLFVCLCFCFRFCFLFCLILFLFLFLFLFVVVVVSCLFFCFLFFLCFCFTVKSRSVTQRSASQGNDFKQSKKSSPFFFRKTIGSKYSLTLTENNSSF